MGEVGAHRATRREQAASVLRRTLAMLVVVSVTVVGFTLVPSQSAQAAVVQWGTAGGTAPNYQTTVNGDFLMAGNGVLACSTLNISNAGTCNNLHAASNTNANNVNDNFNMVNTTPASGFTRNSSAATVTVPAGAKVVKAVLSWSANTGVFTGDSHLTCTIYNTARGVATLPSDGATAYRTRSPQLKIGSAAVASVPVGNLLEDPSSQATALYYSASSDVTSSFSSVATGSPVTLTVGNIWAATGAGCYAGWSMTVVYDYGTYISGKDDSVPHRVIFYEGHVREGINEADLSVAFNGFTAVSAGTRAGFTLFEGDRSTAGDTFAYSRGGSSTYTGLPNAASPSATDNFGIGRAVGSVRYYNTGDTSAFTNQNVDVTDTDLPAVAAGDKTINLQIGTTGDSYLLRNAILSVPVAGIQVDKSYNGTADEQYRTNTEPATFTVTITNTGGGTLQSIVASDDQSDCSRALTGITLAPLASTSFTCRANVPSNSSYVSTSNVTAKTVIGGYAAADSDSTTITVSAITVTKSAALAAGATGKVGDPVNYSFVLRNSGANTLTGITLTDPLPGLSAITFGSWPGGTAGTLAAGASVPATATYLLKQADVDAGSVSNTATTVGTDQDGGLAPTESATATLNIASAGTLAVTKTGTLAAGAGGRVGDVITYAFTMKNTGNVTLKNGTLTDPLPGLSPPAISWPTSTAGTLAPGATATATATYTIKQSDVDAGSVKNTATATGRTPTGTTITGASPQSSVATVASSPSITTTKAGVAAGSAAVGNVITYSFTAKNTGNVTLTGVSISDPLADLSPLAYGAWPGGVAGTLAPGATVTATATYTIKQSDVDAGSVKNTAVSTGAPPSGTAITGASPLSTVATAASAPAVTLTKTGALAAGSTGVAGNTVNYSFGLKNTGNVTLTGVGISDPLAGLSALAYSWPGTAGTLAPGATVTATATYTLKQSDVDAGSVANTATGVGKPPAGANVSQARSATVPITGVPAITVTKSGAVAAGGTGSLGDVVNYTFALKNTGNVTLTQVALADPLPGLSTPVITWPGTAGTLLPGATATATANYTIRQSDVDAGWVKNTSTATGKPPTGANVTATSGQVTVPAIAAAPGITTTKSGAVAGTGAVGDTITYSFTARNSGNVSLSGVAIADPLPGLSALTYVWPGAAGALAPGQTVTATASYTIRQSDVDAGFVKNTAVSSGKPPTGAVVTGASPQSTVLTAASAPAVTFAKSGALAAGSIGATGNTVNYSFAVKNTGNVTLTGVTIADPLVGLSTLTYTWPGAAGSLAPGATATATATYVLKQSDVDAGSVANTATGGGASPTGVSVSKSAPATVPVSATPALLVTKSGIASGAAAVGNVVSYSFAARNTGNVTLTGVVITDPLPGLSLLAYTWPGATGSLAPGQTVTATASYTIRQADVDAGSVKNTATASGRPPTGAAIAASSPQSTVATAAASPSITTTKSAVASGTAGVGSVITYSFTARNSGNVTLTGVAIGDPLPGLSALTYSWPGDGGSLAPGQTVTATATYTITQADVDAGSVKNTATSTGSSATTRSTVSSASPLVTVPTAASVPAVSLVKSGTLAGGSTGVAGDTVNYTFGLKNTGNVTLTGVAITDPLSGLSALSYTWPGVTASLVPGATVTATATYTEKQSDVDAGSVANTATGIGKPPTGATVSRSMSATVPINSAPAISVEKTGTIASPGIGAAGDKIDYVFAIRNTGNVTLGQVSLSDTKAGVSTPVITWPGAPGMLAPGATATATASYTITQADVDAGSVENTASTSGKPPTGSTGTGSTVTATSARSIVPTVAATPAITTTKTGVASDSAGVGAGISYTFTARNSGNVTLTGVGIADPLAGLSSLRYGNWPGGTTGTLAPGSSVTATASYTISQADVDAGSVKNTAVSTGTSPSGAPVTGASPQSTVMTAASVPAVSLTKSGALAAGSTGIAGNTVNYAFALKNTGNVTLTGAAITDPLSGLSVIDYGTWPGGVIGTLAPGASVTATASYTLRQSDVDAGSVANTATGSGNIPTGATVSQSAPATVPVAPAPGLLVTKSGSAAGTASVGNVITYSFTARNSGNVTLTGVAIADPLAGLSALDYGTWPGGVAGTLAPGGTVTATANYTITQSDVDAGSVKNTATAVGKTPGNVTITAASPQSTVATAAAAPSITTTKSGVAAGSAAVGNFISYGFTAKNTGNVTLTGVTIGDPLAGLSARSYTWPGADGTLAPGQTVTATATYTITQADVDAGSVKNTATSTGTSTTTRSTVSGASPQVTVPTATSVAAVSLVKSGALAAGSTGVAGNTVNYSLGLKNTGNVTLTGVAITDPLVGLSAVAYSWPGVSGTLAPGATVTATATYTLKQSDVDAGSVANIAMGFAKPPTGANLSRSTSATVPINSAPAISVEKTGLIASPGTGAVGDTVDYAFAIRNTGNVTLGQVSLVDTKAGVSTPVIVWPGATGTLAPGQTATATARFTITQDDVDAGSVKNTASVSGTPPTGSTVSATSAESVISTVSATPGITTTKTGVVAAGETGGVGSTVRYTITATNSGNVTLGGVSVGDSLAGLSALDYGTWPSGATGVLNPGQSVIATANYRIVQSDVDAGVVLNTATSTGTPPTGPPVANASGVTTVATATSAPSMTFTKTGSLAAGATGVAGNRINYTFDLKNNGNVTLTGVDITDPLAGLSALVFTWPAGTPANTLAPNSTVTATATYTLTQADVDAGSVANAATSVATSPRGDPLSRTAPATVPLAATPAIVVTKTGALAAGATGAVGDAIGYRFTIRNTGNVTLSAVALTDTLPGLTTPVVAWPRGDPVLAPGESVSATASYQITQADIDRGSVSNTATVSGTPPTGDPATASSGAAVVATAQGAPAIATTKAGVVNGTGTVGQTIDYSFTSTNTGQVTLTGVTIADPLTGAVTFGPWPGGVANTLAPGATVTSSATHTITQADVNAGSVRNIAVSSGTSPSGVTVSGSSPESVVATAASAPAVTVVKTGSLAAGAAGVPGDLVTWNYSLSNSGNVTLHGITLSDPLGNPIVFTATGTDPPAPLDPGATLTATATYPLTQADVDAGVVRSAVTAIGSPPSGADVSKSATATVQVSPAPTATLTQSAAVTGAGNVGDTIAYTFVIVNTGNVTLSGLAATASNPTVSNAVVAWPGAAGTLAPGQSATATATHTITQPDVDRGSVRNTETLAGRSPAGALVTATSTEAVVPLVAQASAITTIKNGALAPGATGAVGDIVQYTLRTTNVGNVTLTGVTLTDILPGLSEPTISWPSVAGRLLPGEFATATATYALTQADVDAGKVTNVAVSTGTPPSGANVSDESDPSVVTTAASAPAIAVTHNGTLAAGATGVAGDTIDWTYSLTNSGNVTLHDVSLVDPQIDQFGFTYTWPGAAGALAPGQTVTAVSHYVLTQGDVDAGAVSTFVTGSGTPPTGAAITQDAPATVLISSSSALVVTQAAAIVNPGTGAVGDVIRFDVTVTNTGNVTITNGRLIPRPDIYDVVINWPGTPGTLGAGESLSGHALYKISQVDVDAGSVTNVVKVTGTTPKGVPVPAASNAITILTVSSVPGISTTKSGVVSGAGEVGSTVSYSIVTKNTGNVTLHDVTVADPLPGLSAIVTGAWPGATGTLAPGESVTSTASYLVTQSDVDSGFVTNVATSAGIPPTGGAVTGASAPARVDLQTPRPDIAITKTGSLAPGATGMPGDLITWSYSLINTGNVTLSRVALTDSLGTDLVATWPEVDGTLAPGATVTATATHPLNQAEIDAGSVSSAVTGVGSPPSGADVARSATATVTVSSRPSVSIAQTGTLTSPGANNVGDTIGYQFTVTNTGNVTLSSLDLIESNPMLPDATIAWPGTNPSLAPGATVTGTVVYTISQADIDRGSVKNTESVTATSPANSPVSATSTESQIVLAVQTPAIQTTKAGALESGATGAVGDVIVYSITMANTGNVTLTGVTLADPLAGLSTPVITWPGATGRLLPGQVATARATYAITQADVNFGSITNIATSTGTPPAGESVSGDSVPSVVPTATAAPAVFVADTGVLDPGAKGVAGDTVTFTYSMTNSGNVSLSSVAFSEAIAAISVPTYRWPGSTGVLEPGETVSATATQVLTQADVDAGSVSSIVTGFGTSPAGAVIADTAPATVPIAPYSALVLVQRAALQAPGIGAVGDVIAFSGTVTNTGNVTLHDIRPAVRLTGLYDVVLDWPGTPRILGPGQVFTVHALYKVTQADVDFGSVTSEEDGDGTTPAGVVIHGLSNQVTIQTVSSVPAVSTALSGVVSGGRGVGDTVTYTIVTTNTGNVTLHDVTVVDRLPRISAVVTGDWPGGVDGTLAPGTSVTSTATYLLDQADLDAGSVTNTARSTGTSPTGVAVSADSPTTIIDTAASAPVIAVTHTGALAAGSTARAGDAIDWAYSLSNTGNVTLHGVTLTDPQPGQLGFTYGWPSGTVGELAPGQTVTAVSHYLLTQSDVDAGSVATTVAGAGSPPSGANVAESATATVTLSSNAAVTIMQSAALTAPGTGIVDDTITYSFEVTNSGNVTLSTVRLAQSNSDLPNATISWPGTTTGLLAPGETATGTAIYRISQPDVDRGSVENAETVTAFSPTTATVTATSPRSVVPLAAAAPALTTTKTGTLAAGETGAVGDIIRYDFTVANSGNVTLSGVTLSDPLAGLSTPNITWPYLPGRLLPGQSATATATYAITQADVDAGFVTNVAVSTGTPPSGADVSGASVASIVDTAPTRAVIAVTHTGALAAGSIGVAGDTVNWQYSVTNDGNVTLHDVTLVDAQPNQFGFATDWPSTVGELAPGQTATTVSKYLLTQADVDAGSVVSTVTASGTEPTGTVITQSVPATVAIAAFSALVVTQVGAVQSPGIGAVGDVIRFDVTVANTGNVTVHNGQLVAPLPGLYGIVIDWPVTPGTLGAGESLTGHALYPITQADVDRGSVTNTVDVRGTTPTGVIIRGASNEITIPTVRPAPLIETAKTAQLVGVGDVGDSIDYTFSSTNRGNVTLHGVTIADPLTGLTPIVYGTWPGNAVGELAPGATITGTASYTLIQADVDAGSVTNLASSSGIDPVGTVVSDPTEPVVTVTAPATPSATVTNDSVLAPGATGKAGDAVQLSYRFDNTGNVTLRGVVLADPAGSIVGLDYTWSGDVGVLPANTSVTATATHILTQSDVDSGSYVNLITGSGTPPVGAAAFASAASTVSLSAASGLIITKAGSPTIAGQTGLGDAISYTFSAQNTGDVTLSGVAITDALDGVSALDYSWPGAVGTLAPGAIVTATARYRISQDDIDLGRVDNAATVSATTPAGVGVLATSALSSVATDAAAPALAVTKAGHFTSGTGGAGSVIGYDFVIANRGNVTLHLVNLQDALVGVSTPVLAFPSATGILQPGDVATATASYAVSQADVDSGSVVNIATTSGTAPDGTILTAASEAATIATAARNPAIQATQSAALAAGALGVVGDLVDYSFTITNPGNVTLSAVALRNSVVGLGTPAFAWPGAVGVLAPGTSATATATHTITQADVDAGVVRNVATATGMPSTGAAVSDRSAAISVPTIGAQPHVSIAKSGNTTGTGSLGDGIDWSFTVTNDGNVTLTGVEISDALPGLSSIDYTWPAGTRGLLAPGESMNATARSSISQADVDAGAVDNVATVSGTSPSGIAVSGTSGTVTVPTVASNPVISLDKQQTLPSATASRPGDVVEYSFQLANAGNTTLSGVTITDDQVGISAVQYTWPAVPGVLLPGQTATASARYVLTQADIDAGSLGSTATALATTPASTRVAATARADLILASLPSVSIDLTGTFETYPQQTGRILYGYVATNTGNVTLTALQIIDPLTGISAITVAWPGAVGVLLPGQSATATSAYTITQADVDTGSVTNSTTVAGNSPGGVSVTGTDSEVSLVPDHADIELSMSVSPEAGEMGFVGDTLVFRYRAVNSGTRSLRAVAITDRKVGLSAMSYGAWPAEVGALQPGQAITATASMVVTESSAGTLVSNSASVSAIDVLTGDTVSDVAGANIQLPTLPIPPIPPIIAPLVPIALAFTGAAPAPWLGAAMLLLLSGLLLTMTARTGRTTRTTRRKEGES